MAAILWLPYHGITNLAKGVKAVFEQCSDGMASSILYLWQCAKEHG